MNLKEFALEVARDALEILPFTPAVILASERRVVFPLDFSNEERKAVSVELVRRIARETRTPVAYVLEAWASRKLGVPPSEDPDRMDAVVVAAFSPSTRIVVVLLLSRDDDGGPVLGDPQVFPDAESWMDPWPDRKPVN